MIILGIIKHAIMITSFVLIMMLFIEYLNIKTQGKLEVDLQNNRFKQYLLAIGLGITPGCLGAFTVVSLYSHRIVSFGALVATMIATSGDESFVMFSMIPKDAFILHIILFFLAFIVAYMVDFLFRNKQLFFDDHKFEVHQKEYCHCFSKQQIMIQLKNIIPERLILFIFFGIFTIALALGILGGDVWNWKKIIFALGSLGSIFIIATVPNHFLQEHIYKHIIKKHLLRIFLWTFGALLTVHFVENYLNISAWIETNTISILGLATIIGIIPESGPHMIFVTMFAKGLVPFAVLLASSISQDGHGTLPLLSVSRKVFIYLKLINVIVAFVIGFIFLQLGLV
jgi:hypothetical protein